MTAKPRDPRATVAYVLAFAVCAANAAFAAGAVYTRMAQVCEERHTHSFATAFVPFALAAYSGVCTLVGGMFIFHYHRRDFK